MSIKIIQHISSIWPSPLSLEKCVNRSTTHQAYTFPTEVQGIFPNRQYPRADNTCSKSVPYIVQWRGGEGGGLISWEFWVAYTLINLFTDVSFRWKCVSSVKKSTPVDCDEHLMEL
jgi:hypothetical protein